MPRGMGAHVARDHPDAVGIVAGEVGGNQMVGDEGRFAGGAAEVAEKGNDKLMQIRSLKAMSGRH